MLTADRATRTLTADPLLPYGESGRTNLGRVTASKGHLQIPADVTGLVMNLQHERNAPVAKFATVSEGPTGLRATFTVPATRAGDDLLAEVEAGLRKGVSVEIDNPVIRDGQLLGGVLAGAAAVVDPAFPSAQLIAADAGDLEDEDETPEDEQPSDDTDDESEEEAPVADEKTVETVEDEGTEPMQASLPASLRKKNINPAKTKSHSLFAALAETPFSERPRLLAALDQIVQADGVASQQAQWIGEVYARKTYTRQVADLIEHDNLTSLNIVGWKFTTTPTVAPWTGFPTQPNSTAGVATAAVTTTAARIAGAAAVDRAFQDFNVPDFWAGYFRACADSYEQQLDAVVLAALVATNTAVSTSTATIPAGVSPAAAMIVDGAMSVIAAMRGLPTFALVGMDLYKPLLLTKAQDTLEYLNMALGLQSGTLNGAGFVLRPSADASLTGKVLVGTRAAATVWELAGSPTRVDTVSISTGAIETGLFGYHAELVKDAGGLALVSKVA